jgi:hypothetical protein
MLTSNFWGIYGMDFPEVSDIKAPRDLACPFGDFFLCFHESSSSYKDQLNLQSYNGGSDHGFQISGPELEVY